MDLPAPAHRAGAHDRTGAAIPERRRGLQERALKQAGRELLLAQSSDWPFILRTGTSPDYARKRVKDHLLRFMRCTTSLPPAVSTKSGSPTSSGWTTFSLILTGAIGRQDKAEDGEVDRIYTIYRIRILNRISSCKSCKSCHIFYAFRR